jgi:hypothetical protein
MMPMDRRRLSSSGSILTKENNVIYPMLAVMSSRKLNRSRNIKNTDCQEVGTCKGEFPDPHKFVTFGK